MSLLCYEHFLDALQKLITIYSVTKDNVKKNCCWPGLFEAIDTSVIHVLDFDRFVTNEWVIILPQKLSIFKHLYHCIYSQVELYECITSHPEGR